MINEEVDNYEFPLSKWFNCLLDDDYVPKPVCASPGCTRASLTSVGDEYCLSHSWEINEGYEELVQRREIKEAGLSEEDVYTEMKARGYEEREIEDLL